MSPVASVPSIEDEPAVTSVDDFKKTYFEECAELLDALYAQLTNLAEQRADDETMHAIFRAVHSIKGGGGAFGFDRLVAFAHVFETLLDLMRDGRVTANALPASPARFASIRALSANMLVWPLIASTCPMQRSTWPRLWVISSSVLTIIAARRDANSIFEMLSLSASSNSAVVSVSDTVCPST